MYYIKRAFILTIVFLFTISKANSLNIPENANSDWLKNNLEELGNILKHGLPSMNIPILDPLTINETVNLNNPNISLVMNIQGELSDYTDYSVGKANLNKNLSSEVEITFHRPNFKGKFVINGTALKIIPLDSKGLAEIGFTNMKLSIKATMEAKSKIVQVTDFDLQYDLDDVKVNIEGLWNDFGLQYLWRDIILDLVPNVLSKYKQQLESLIVKNVLTVGNNELRQVGIRTVIELAKDYAS